MPEKAASASPSLAGGDQQVEVGAGLAGRAVADRRAQDDAVGGVDRFEDLGRVASGPRRGRRRARSGSIVRCRARGRARRRAPVPAPPALGGRRFCGVGRCPTDADALSAAPFDGAPAACSVIAPAARWHGGRERPGVSRSSSSRRSRRSRRSRWRRRSRRRRRRRPGRGSGVAGSIAAGPGGARGRRRAAVARGGSRPRPGRRARPRTPAGGWAAGPAAPRRARNRLWESFIACLPQLGHRPVQPGARVRLADAEHGRDLGVGEPGEELERDQLALCGLERRQRRRPAPAGARSARRRPRPGRCEKSTGSAASSACRPVVAARRAPRCGRCRRARRGARRGRGRSGSACGRRARRRSR